MNISEQDLAIAQSAGEHEPLTKAQAAAYAKVSKKTIERWMKSGLTYLPGPRFTKAHINGFLEALAITKYRPTIRRVA